MSKEHEFHIVEDNEYPMLKIKQRYPYNRIIQLLLEGHEIFIELNRKSAYYFKKELQKKTGLPIESYPAYYKKMKGYVFRISLVREFLRRVHEGGGYQSSDKSNENSLPHTGQQ